MCHVYNVISEELPVPVMVMLFLRFSWTLVLKAFNITLYTIMFSSLPNTFFVVLDLCGF